MTVKLTKTPDLTKKFSAKEYHYDDGIDPKDLLNKTKPAKHNILRKLFHT